MGEKIKLKASTLMESLIAMVLIMLTMAISGMIYANVLSGSDNVRKLHAHLLLDEVAAKMRYEDNYLDGEIKVKEWVVKRTISSYKDLKGVKLLALKVIDERGKLLSERKEIISVPE